MHEFSLCESLVKAILGELSRFDGRDGVKLLKARLVVGKLRQVIPENLRFAYEVLTKDTPAAGSQLEIAEIPIAASCKACGWTGQIDGKMFVCGACQSVNIEVTGGKELYLDEMEIEGIDDATTTEETHEEG